MKNRNQEVDITKGIAILMVIFIHTASNFGFGNLNTVSKFALDLMFCSCISAFFISAGFFAHKETWHSFLSKKGRGILIPFCAFYILGFLIVPIVNLIPGLHAHTPFSWNEIFSIFYSHGSRNGALWFLIALLNALLFLQIILRVKNLWLQLLLALVVFGIGRWEHSLPHRLPLYLGSGCMAFGYVYLGYWLRQWGVLDYLKRSRWMVLTFIVSFTFVVLNRENQQFIKLNYVTGPFLLTVLTNIMGAVSILAVSALIRKNKYLEYCGRTTLPILCVHSLFTQVVCRVTMSVMDPASWYNPLISFVIIVLLTHLAAEFLLRYCPIIVGKRK